jgi:hypothetical protein
LYALSAYETTTTTIIDIDELNRYQRVISDYRKAMNLTDPAILAARGAQLAGSL